MKGLRVLALSAVLAGCATEPPARHPDSVFNDQWFAQPSERISADDAFAMSAEMRQYLATEIIPGMKDRDVQKTLFDRLYVEGQLKLDYDATITRNAAQAFAARSGSCLSLVMLTAAFARELGVPVRFQMVYVDEAWSRRDGIEISTEHVNVTLGAKAGIGTRGGTEATDLTIDFLPPKDLGSRRTRVLAENTIVAMYMNNRAAESLNEPPFNRAYWWVRAAIAEDPRYMPAYNTLGIVYKLHGNLREAQQVFERILEIEPENTMAMGNLLMVFKALGKTSEADALAAKLKAIRPYPPFYYFDQGVEAMKQQDFIAARKLFTQQIQRDAFYNQSHYWLGLAYFQLGDVERAERELAVAIDTSTTSADRERFSSELARLQASRQ
jgi:Tfp pilus assembly protein PilF